MKVLAIGDIHGKTIWKEIIKLEADNFDKIVFIGDYLDSFEYDTAHMLNNLEEILTVKRAMPDKIVLLYGNHCHHYALSDQQYSGYKPAMAVRAKELFIEALSKGEIQATFHADNVFYVHAGVTNSWLRKAVDQLILEDSEIKFTGEQLSVFINDCLIHKPSLFDFQYDKMYPDPYGDNIWQSPIWIRPRAFVEDKFSDLTYVVGHTRQQEISRSEDKKVCFIDCLDTTYEMLTAIDGEISTKSLYSE